MKKTLLTIMLIVAFVSICGAQRASLAYIEASKAPHELYQQAQALQNAGVEIYYYNQAGFLVAPDSARHQSLNIAKTIAPDGQLYLVSSPDGSLPQLPDDAGTPVLQLGSVILLDSPLDEVSLRQKIRYSFVPLRQEPLKLPEPQSQSSFNATASDDIQAIVNLVQTSSVLSMIQSLQDFGTRFALADNRLTVSEWIRDQFISFGVPNVELQSFEWRNTIQNNVVATIPGSVYPDEYIIVGGHHDSINSYDNPYIFAPGADDNASGAVACLEMARVMMASGFQPKRSIRFITYAAEEFGLWGSKYDAAQLAAAELDIRLMINHDMISNNVSAPGDWQVRLMPYWGCIEHSLHAQKLTSLYTDLEAYFGELNSPSSDSASYWGKGYNVVYFFESHFSPYYHSSNDIVANIDPDYAAEVIKASTAVAANFADMPAAPTNLSVQDYGDGQSLRLTWKASTDPSVSNYRVYWGTNYGNLLQNHVDCSGDSFVLSGLTEGTEYMVSVSALDAGNLESVSISGSGTPNLYPLAPTGFADDPQNDRIQLSWQPNSEYDLAGYHLYRNSTPGAEPVLLATLAPSETSYVDRRVSGGLHSYYYRIYAFDADGNLSACSKVLCSRPFTMDQGVLIIDETIGGNGNSPMSPTDEMLEEFYADVLAEYQPHLINVGNIELNLADLGAFSAVLWHAHDQAQVGFRDFNDITREYVQRGGKLLLSTLTPSFLFERISAPASFAPGMFIYDVLGIAETDLTNQSRFKTALPLQAGFPQLQVDPLKSAAALNHHLFKIEGMTPTNDATAIYSYSGDYADDSPQGYLNGRAVGIRNEYGNGTAITLSFPLYHMVADSAKAMVQHVFRHDFDQLYPSEAGSNTPPVLSLSQPSPNPFSNTVSITLKARNFDKNATVKVYNQRGQLVHTLMRDLPYSTQELKWDGRDEQGRKVGSGVYFLQAKQGKHTATKKIVLIR